MIYFATYDDMLKAVENIRTSGGVEPDHPSNMAFLDAVLDVFNRELDEKTGESYDSGYDDGNESGYNAGYEDGYEEGYQKTHVDASSPGV